MSIDDLLTAGFRNAFIVIGFGCIFAGLLVRRTGATSRGLGMALIVVGAVMIVAATAGRIYGWW